MTALPISTTFVILDPYIGTLRTLLLYCAASLASVPSPCGLRSHVAYLLGHDSRFYYRYGPTFSP